MQTKEEKIRIAQFEAERYNRIGDQNGVAFWVDELEKLWEDNPADNRAAFAFYTHLEKTFPQVQITEF